jgi:acyl dehydratase
MTHLPEVGDKATRSLEVTDKHIELFAEMTGDRNPLHFDPEFAAKTKFGRLVAQGGVTAGLLNALVAMDMPGPGTVFMSQELKYVAPVFIGDTITAEAEVLAVRETRNMTQLGFTITRQDGTKVLTGTAWCYTFRPDAG